MPASTDNEPTPAVPRELLLIMWSCVAWMGGVRVLDGLSFASRGVGLTWPVAPGVELIAAVAAIAIFFSIPRWRTPSRIHLATRILALLGCFLIIGDRAVVGLAIFWVSRDLRDALTPPDDSLLIGYPVTCLECGATIASNAVRCEACGWSFVPPPSADADATSEVSRWTPFLLWSAVAVSVFEWARAASAPDAIVSWQRAPALSVIAACLALWFSVPDRRIGPGIRRATNLVGALGIAMFFLPSFATLPLGVAYLHLHSSPQSTPMDTYPARLAADPVG